MLLILSPSKTLDFEDELSCKETSQPALLTQSKKLIKELRKLSEKDIQKLMSLSEKLAGLNYERYQKFKTPLYVDGAKIGEIKKSPAEKVRKFCLPLEDNDLDGNRFVDVGIKESGLIHVSEMADRFISDPNEIVKLHEHVKVRVKDVDIARKRIQLSLKGVAQD